jgi:raffinose/stachyose/melibiose transport system substrate-binding protein
VNAYKTVSESGGMVPYLDYATPTFYDTLSGAVQQLTDGQVTPEQFAETLQDDYSAFLEKK